MCVGYRASNNMIVKHQYPMPKIHDLLDALHGIAIFGKTNLKPTLAGVRDEDAYKVAFSRSHFGQ